MNFTRHQAVGAYQRWEPPAFDAPPSAEQAPSPPPEADTPIAEAPILPPGVKLPTAEEIEHIHDEARKNGFEAGFAEGREAGHAAGLAEGREAGMAAGREAGFTEGQQTGFAMGQQKGFASGKIAVVNEITRLREIFVNLEFALTRLDTEIGEELMALAIELARKVLQHTLDTQPEVIKGVIHEALQHLPHKQAEIHLNPDDMELMRKHLDDKTHEEEHRLIEDDSVSRGGCRIEAAGAQIDATMETRWRRVLESLGRKHSPWEPLPPLASLAKADAGAAADSVEEAETPAIPPQAEISPNHAAADGGPAPADAQTHDEALPIETATEAVEKAETPATSPPVEIPEHTNAAADDGPAPADAQTHVEPPPPPVAEETTGNTEDESAH